MKYDFDKIVPRDGTCAIKTDMAKKLYRHDDIIPMWVADMDFSIPQCIMEQIKRRAEHPIMGYTYRPDSFFGSVINWIGTRGNWKTEASWMDFIPGVVPGISYAIRAFTREGDGIVIQPPVYHPFAGQITANGRKVINNPLKEIGGRYEIDFEDLDKKLCGAKVLLVSNPHNPVGRVFTRDELTEMGRLCEKHDVLIFSDEIHCDLVYAPHRHIHFASLGDEVARRTITFIAPSKTFNMAGLSTAVVITSDDILRRRLRGELNTLHAGQGNIFGNIALEAAYNYGSEWLEELLKYLRGNIDYVASFLKTDLPEVTCTPTEGTYLMWLDFRNWELPHEEIYSIITDRARIGVNEGKMFGADQGQGWMRLNIASPRATVELAMERIAKAYKER